MSFFHYLQNHSEIKLSILKEYTIPWMRRVILNKYGPRKCLIIDGFAGPGKYENSINGSPMILIKNSIEFYEQSRENGWYDPEIYIFLNEYNPEHYLKLIDNVNELGFNSLNNKEFNSERYKSIYILIENKDFEEFMTSILSITDKGNSLIPSFCFVDPFGFSSTPFSIFVKYLENNNAELLINFIYEFTNRFIRHPNEIIQRQISNHLGLVNLGFLGSKIKDLTASERKKMIIKIYSENILEKTSATYVKNFDIRVEGKTKMILFHVTKNIHGLKLMKETMWKFDDTGQYVYDVSSKRLKQLVFDEILTNDRQNHLDILSKQILARFSNKNNITIKKIEDFVTIDTDYPVPNFMKPALIILEENKAIHNIRGRKRPKTYPKNTIMDFN